MTKHLTPMAFAAGLAVLPLISLPAAQAKPCNAARPSSPHGYWSWRLIDGRKCWYEGQPGLSKSLLEWPRAQTSAQVASAKDSPKEIASNLATKPALAEKPGNPMDAHAQVQAAPDTFEALWRYRIVH